MKLTMQKIKNLIKEELRKLSESTGDNQVDYFIDALSDYENIDITVKGDLITVTVSDSDPDDPSINHIYKFDTKRNIITFQGWMDTNDYGSPYSMGSNNVGYITEKPKSSLEFLKLISNKSGGLG